jgi:hypothetical protein
MLESGFVHHDVCYQQNRRAASDRTASLDDQLSSASSGPRRLRSAPVTGGSCPLTPGNVGHRLFVTVIDRLTYRHVP